MEHSDAIKHLGQDERLREVIHSTSLQPMPAIDGSLYHGLLRAIIYQQLSGKAADAIYARFLSLFEDGVPHAESLLQVKDDSLRAAGLSRQKAGYVKNVARFFRDEQLRQADWASREDEALIDYLAQIKGVGRWTVQMILMYNLHRPDVFPVGDLGIQQAMAKLYGLSGSDRTLRHRMVEIAEAWRPYRSYACRYLWSWMSQA